MTRVSIFIGSLTGGGAERVTVALSRYLLEEGFGVGVITMHRADRDFYELDPRVERLSLGMAGASQGLGKVSANLRRIRALRAAIRRQRANVVIGMMSTSAVLATLACLGLATRVIASERNYPGLKSAERPWALLRRLVYRFADAHVAQTYKGAEWIRRRTGARNVHVIANSVSWPVPGRSPEVAPDSVVAAEARVVLAVGSKIEQKGFDLLVEAFASAAADRPEWQLVILGLDGAAGAEGPRAALREKAGLSEAGARIHFPGRVGNMADWYRRADIFVLSSRYEGFPNALLEAMAAGRASVAFDCDTGPGEIIEDRKDGLLAPPEDTPALSSALRELMDDPGLRRRLGSAAESVRERFSEQRVLGRWKRVIQALAA